MIKPLILFSAVVLFLANKPFAQNNVVNPSNTREGESVEYCITHKKMNELLQDPEYRKAREKAELELKAMLTKKEAIAKGTVYKIPIVFHVLHNNGAENISDEQIFDAVKILNRAFRLQNADANDVQPAFKGMPRDAEIEFVLATKDPNGNCFKGITRTISPASLQGNNPPAQVNAIRNGNDVYRQNWPGNKYLNVFVVGDAGGAAGFTSNPSSFLRTDMSNGIFILHNYVGSIGTGSKTRSQALIHEAGHWLNLEHTWGSTNDPGLASNCGADDGVDDTPNCIGTVNKCPPNTNTCNTIDAFNGQDNIDNIENYMEYSYCSKMFTQGQVDRMRAALLVQSTGRSDLWQSSNLLAVGANGELNLCRAEFTSDKTSVCSGGSVTFMDKSYNTASGWKWQFEGGAPETSLEQNPVVRYDKPGIYSVTLSASDATTSDQELKTGYVRVLAPSGSLPFYEDFEEYASLSNLSAWELYNENNNNTFELEKSFGLSGTKCAKLINFGQTGSNVDELISSPLDLSNFVDQGDKLTLSFRYAYRKRTSSDVEYLRIFVSDPASVSQDCLGKLTTLRHSISGNGLSSLTSSTSWAPVSSSDWVTVHVTTISKYYWIDNFRFKFQFQGNGGNNIYLDDINVYVGAPSDNIVLDINETEALQDLQLYPNPADNELNLRFSVTEPQKTVVQITDLSGKQIETQIVNAAMGTNLVLFDAAKYAAGSYLMTVSTLGGRKVLPFVMKR
jgi:PKD repeat protein